ncbi:type II toxin-antitoxin system VapC family toxin [bacterium]|nr:type II toxin-antitoxin system VapC family toxin [bacterium]
MGRYLLDTLTILWWLKNSKKLGKKSIKTTSNPDNEVYVSAVNLWEICIKKKIGKLKAPDNLVSICEEKGFLPLPITLTDGEELYRPPFLHKDPFDRMLVVQAQNNHLAIITNDEHIPKYNIITIQASQ